MADDDRKTSTQLHETDEDVPLRPQRSKSWDQKNAIVYDVYSQHLSTEQKVMLNERHYTKVAIPKRARSPLIKDRVRLSVSYMSPDMQVFLADIKLDSLGLGVTAQRWSRNVNEIWVTGLPSATTTVIAN